jgi:hypothetical protein
VSRASFKDRLKAAAAEWVASADPPPGSVGSDRDGALVWFGCKPWIAEYEGQRPGLPPPPTDASRHDPATCEVCRQALTDPRVTGAGCLTSGQDGWLIGEMIRDDGRAAVRAAREAAERGPQDFASRRTRKRHRKPT